MSSAGDHFPKVYTRLLVIGLSDYKHIFNLIVIPVFEQHWKMKELNHSSQHALLCMGLNRDGISLQNS